MSKLLEGLSASQLTTAIDANLSASREIFGCLPQAEIHNKLDITWHLTNLSHLVFNGVCRARFTPENADARIADILSHFTARKVPMRWLVGPTTQPTDLGKRLEAHGLIHTGEWSGMAADLLALNESVPASPDLTIDEVNDRETLREWLSPFTVGYQFPKYVATAFYDLFVAQGFGSHLPWRLYLGRLAGTPIATSAVFVGAGVAGICWVATVPEARRQGAGAAVTLAPLRAARAMGYHIAILQATQMGQGVYRQLGFQECGKVGLYVKQVAET